MSIIRMLTRLTAVAALRGHTWADDRVFDSDNTPLSQALALNAAAKPYIVVYTDGDNRLEIQGTDMTSIRREVSLVFEIGVASKVEGEKGNVQLRTPLTDEGMEIALDMVEDQVMAALFGNPQSDWAELLKNIIIRIDRVVGQRGASADRDRRWAARQLTVVCDILSDVPIGVKIPHDHPIREFIEVSKSHPEAHMDHASEICQALVDQEVAPDWEQIQATLGVRRLGLQAIGLAPVPSDLPVLVTEHGEDLTDKDGQAPRLRKITLDEMDKEGEVQRYVDTDIAGVKVKEPKDKVAADGSSS